MIKLKIIILFFIILFYQPNSKAAECYTDTFEELANCTVEEIDEICPFGSLYNNTKVKDRFGKKNLRMSSLESGNCGGKFNKIFNKTPRVYIFTENNSSYVSWVEVYLGSYEQETFDKILKYFNENYSREINFPSENGINLLNERKIRNLILFFDNFTKGVNIDGMDGFAMNLIFFNSSSDNKIEKNKEFFIDLNNKINSEGGSGNQF
ncbi:hypothetical protein OAO20_04245 [Candidatus Pelagibacter ubique]|nr:hypothetical protein [Candidatus Pelagibacter ubique]